MQKFSLAQQAKLNIEYAASGEAIATARILPDAGLSVLSVDVTSFLTQFASAAQGVLAAAAQPGLTYLVVEDQKAANTDGGDFTSGAWRTRVLSTAVVNTITGASLASNQITLPAGTFYIDAQAPAFQVDRHKAQLYDTTGAAVLLLGSSEYSDSTAAYSVSASRISGFFTLAVASALEIQHRCQTDQAGNGFGEGANLGVLEVYTRAVIVKVA